MSIIPRESVTTAPNFAFTDIMSHAEYLIAAARKHSDQLIAEARKNATKLVEQDRKDAFNAGLEEGRRAFDQKARDTAIAQARDRLNSVLGALSNAVANFNTEKWRVLAAAQTGLITLAFEIAARVCKNIAGRCSETAVANARSLLEMVRHEHDLRLHVNSDDHAALLEAMKESNGKSTATATFEIIADPHVSKGGCVLSSATGTIDATIEVQLDRIAHAILHDSGYTTNSELADRDAVVTGTSHPAPPGEVTGTQ